MLRNESQEIHSILLDLYRVLLEGYLLVLMCDIHTLLILEVVDKDSTLLILMVNNGLLTMLSQIISTVTGETQVCSSILRSSSSSSSEWHSDCWHL